MATYPGTINSFTNPSGTSTVDVVDHALQHTNINNDLNGVETVLGTTAGTSVLKNFVAGDLAARRNNETFGTPTITLGGDTTGDLLVRSAGGTLSRLVGTTSGLVLTAQGAGVLPIYTSAPSTGSFAIGTFIKSYADTAPGTTTFVAGFVPSLIHFDYGDIGGKFSGQGAYNNGTQYSLFTAQASGYLDTDMVLGYSLYFSNTAGVNVQGSITSTTGGTVTIIFSKVSTPTGTAQILWQAYK